MDKKPQKSWLVLFRAIGMVIAGITFTVSWVSTFVNIPQINDWRIGILISGVLFVGFTLWHFITMQNQIKVLELEIEELKSGDSPLNLYVDTGNHIYPNKDAEEFVLELTINVINQETQKIVDLEAHLESIDWLTEENTGVWHHLPFIRKNRLEWEDGSYQIVLRPGIQDLKQLKIAILNCTKLEFKFAHEDLPRIFKYFQGNAIYRIRIKFNGKLEGNPEYKYCYDEKEFICVPQQCKLDFLPNAAKFPELPEKFKKMLKPFIQNGETNGKK